MVEGRGSGCLVVDGAGVLQDVRAEVNGRVALLHAVLRLFFRISLSGLKTIVLVW